MKNKRAFKLAEVFSTHSAGQRKYAFTLAEVFSTHFAGQRKYAFTLAEVFSTHFAGQRKYAFTLAEVFSTHFAGQRKYAFTLAEVLITLGIIGVVAAMTMPTILTKYRTKVLQSQFKKTYSELSQINQRFIGDYDMNMCEYCMALYSSATGNNSTKVLADKFGEYFITKNKMFQNQNVAASFAIKQFKTLQNGQIDVTIFDDAHSYDFMKRTYYFEYGNASKCPVITVDINGSENKPNKLGYDIFAFRPTKNGKIIPIGKPDTFNDVLNGSGWYGQSRDSSCSMTDDSSRSGTGCAYWAFIDVNPDDNSKTYWNDFIKF